MASEYGLFWNSRGGDRIYNADSMEEWLKPFFVTGVFNGELQVTAVSGMTISVDAGYCNVNGKIKKWDEATEFTLANASGTYNRVDTVVIERNDGERTISLKVITGDSSGEPAAPVRESGVYQLVLAQIHVGADVTAITQADITDTRVDSELCGYVVSAPDTPDFTSIYAQFVEQFEQWFDDIKGKLDEDIAGHLQLEIDNKRRITTKILSASNWSSNTYDLTSDFPNSEYDIEIAPYNSMSNVQLAAYNDAVMIGNGTSNVITSLGVVPTIDIPVMVIYYTK